MIKPRITTIPEKKFIGQHMTMSFAGNRTFDLWHRFMLRRKEIQNNIGIELYSIEIYPPSFFYPFDPAAEFEKWAAVEVENFKAVPEEMDMMISPTGLYAVFIHKGPASRGAETYGFIFNSWLPGSEYLLDGRPHFAVMGEKYKKDDPASEEELWIPVTSNNHFN